MKVMVAYPSSSKVSGYSGSSGRPLFLTWNMVAGWDECEVEVF